MSAAAGDPTRLVARGYDLIAERYATWGGPEPRGAKQRFLERALTLTPPAARLLDLGCGTGAQVTRHLAAHACTVGVDVSRRSIELAASTVPAAHFVCGDMASIAFRPASFDGVVAFFSLIHVPRERHAAVLTSVRSWLRPGGFLVVTMSASAHPTQDAHGAFLGVPMYWSGWDAEANVALVRACGFAIVTVDDVADDEDGVPVTHRWVVATADEVPDGRLRP